MIHPVYLLIERNIGGLVVFILFGLLFSPIEDGRTWRSKVGHHDMLLEHSNTLFSKNERLPHTQNARSKTPAKVGRCSSENEQIGLFGLWHVQFQQRDRTNSQSLCSC
jgi:hypothetical protein